SEESRVWSRGQKEFTDKFTESVYVLANEPSVALYRLQEHVRRSLPELAQHKADMQRWEEQSQGAIYTVEYACSAVKNLVDSSVYFRSVEGLLKQAISIRDHMNASLLGPPAPTATLSCKDRLSAALGTAASRLLENCLFPFVLVSGDLLLSCGIYNLSSVT
uniref:BLOC-1 related complex subunit 8 n=1 Tax=Pan troglodytes TaxID=9598 RepID=A0A2I3TQZ9_PANTR